MVGATATPRLEQGGLVETALPQGRDVVIDDTEPELIAASRPEKESLHVARIEVRDCLLPQIGVNVFEKQVAHGVFISGRRIAATAHRIQRPSLLPPSLLGC